MTALEHRVRQTPLAPYLGLLDSMTDEEKRTVVAYIIAIMEKPEKVRQVPAEFKKLRGMVSITDEEIAQDERLAHIMQQ